MSKENKTIGNAVAALHKAFDHRVRLGIMSILMVNEEADFTTLRDTLGVSDGALASHLRALEKEQLVAFEKGFSERKPRTVYRATSQGTAAFQAHLAELERIVRTTR